MERNSWIFRIHPAWWTTFFIVGTVSFVLVCSAFFAGTFRSFVPVTLTADRAGLVMESGAKVKMRGIEVGRVATLDRHGAATNLRLELSPHLTRHIPANVIAEIRATTLFGAKYVELRYPDEPSPEAISAGAVVRAANVTAEINTVYQSLVNVLSQIDPPKLNAVLAALADGVRGQGDRIGEATTAANEVLAAVNPRMPAMRENWRAIGRFSDAYDAAAPDILVTLDALSTTAETITEHETDLDALLINSIGMSRAGIDLLGPNQDNLIEAINVLEPTTNLLHTYNPVYTCLLMGAKWFLDNGGYDAMGGNGRSAIFDSGFNWGDDPYRYPDHLQIVAAKGGPGGRPGCGSLPDASKNFPIRQLVTNTGWGTGNDIRTNPGLGNPWWANFLPVTRAVPEPPSIRGTTPPPPPPPQPEPVP
ncbi:MCE family protein [Mycolicibacterium thermoresistibile]